MPKEVKNIYFSQLELRNALTKFSTRRNYHFDLTDIKKLEIKHEKGIKISLEVEEYLDFENNKIEFTHTEIAVALMSFCMDCNIPLPKLATKELHVNAVELFLVITLGHELNDIDFFEIE